MNDKPAVLFIVFNRPDRTARVFEAIRRYKPSRLYIAADGPRWEAPDDQQSCKAVRDLLAKPDWDCSVKRLYRDENLGPKLAVTDALSWFFTAEEEGIILEDDCLPGDSFFHFCSQLLEKYRHDHRIMHIGGSNLQFGRQRGDASYYFSSIASIWGWAGWRRVWQKYDPHMRLFEEFEKTDLMSFVFPDQDTARWCLDMTRAVYEGRILTWDYPLAFSIMINNGLCITPNRNLVSNIGFGSGGTRTTNADDIHANIPILEMEELVHPHFYIPHRQADLYQLSLSMPKKPAISLSRPSLLDRIVGKATRSIKKIMKTE